MKKTLFTLMLALYFIGVYAWNPMKVGDKFSGNRLLLDSDGEMTSFEDLAAEGRPIFVASNTTNCPNCDGPNSDFADWMKNNPNERIKMTVVYSVYAFNQAAKMGYSNTAKNGTDKGYVNDWRNKFPGYDYARGFAYNYNDQYWFPDEQGSTPFWWAIDAKTMTFSYRGGGGDQWEGTKNFILKQYTDGKYTAYTSQCPAPKVNINNATNQATVTINNIPSGATVYYTTDGTIPSKTSPVYSSPFTVKMSTLLRVQAYKANTFNSRVILREIKITSTNETNVAPTGTAYSWNNDYRSANLSNANRVARAGLNDNNTTADVKLVETQRTKYPDGFNGSAWQYATWQGGGVVWNNSMKNITKFEYYQGKASPSWWGAHGVYQYDIKLELTTDGTTWVNAEKWGYTTEFPYNSFYGYDEYDFPATQIVPSPYTPITFFLDNPTTIKGFRIMGGFNVFTNYDQSDYINVRELKAFQDNTLTTDVTSPIENNDLLAIYPNPTLDVIHVNFGFSVSNALVEILDLQGRTVISKIVTAKQNESIDVSNLSNGVYFVKVATNGKVMNRKFVKK